MADGRGGEGGRTEAGSSSRSPPAAGSTRTSRHLNKYCESEYGAFSDDFYLNMNLSTEMELPQGRESVLHYFEQVRRRYPKMQNFYAREKGEYVLEEEKDAGAYRWVSVESKRVNSGVDHRAARYVVRHVGLITDGTDAEGLDVVGGVFGFVLRPAVIDDD